MDVTIIIGYIGGALTTVSFVPQVIRTWKMRETKDFSLAMLLLFGGGIAVWSIYGIEINSFPIIVANFCTFILILFLVMMKIKYN